MAKTPKPQSTPAELPSDDPIPAPPITQQTKIHEPRQTPKPTACVCGIDEITPPPPPTDREIVTEE